MLLFLIGLTVLCGLLCLVALVSSACALLARLRRADQGTPFLALMLPLGSDSAKSNGIAEKCAERRKAW